MDFPPTMLQRVSNHPPLARVQEPSSEALRAILGEDYEVRWREVKEVRGGKGEVKKKKVV